MPSREHIYYQKLIKIMKKFNPVILTSVICAVIFLIISSWVFNYGWSILPYLILAGCFLAWVQNETVARKFIIKLSVGSLIFGFLSAILIFLRMYVMSNFIYDTPMPISGLWEQDTRTMALVFSFVSFLGGLFGIVLKGFYSLYKNKLDLVLVFVSPLLIMLSSIAVYKIKIGGTIMSALHGWPYPFLIHQIKDVIDNFSIDKWIFSPGSFYHYIIFDYLIYFTLFLTGYFVIKLINKKLKTKKINSTLFLFGLLVLLVLYFSSAMSVKESYISSQIANAGYCQENSDCVIVANRLPFSCAIISNKDNADRILRLVNSYPSTGELECLGNQKAICSDQKCQVLSYDKGLNKRNWERLKQAIENCEVASIMQIHSLEVTAVLKNGKMIMALEPEIDNIFDVISRAQEKCGAIKMATE